MLVRRWLPCSMRFQEADWILCACSSRATHSTHTDDPPALRSARTALVRTQAERGVESGERRGEGDRGRGGAGAHLRSESVEGGGRREAAAICPIALVFAPQGRSKRAGFTFRGHPIDRNCIESSLDNFGFTPSRHLRVASSLGSGRN